MMKKQWQIYLILLLCMFLYLSGCSSQADEYNSCISIEIKNINSITLSALHWITSHSSWMVRNSFPRKKNLLFRLFVERWYVFWHSKHNHRYVPQLFKRVVQGVDITGGNKILFGIQTYFWKPWFGARKIRLW